MTGCPGDRGKLAVESGLGDGGPGAGLAPGEFLAAEVDVGHSHGMRFQS